MSIFQSESAECGGEDREMRPAVFSCINHSYWLIHSEHMFGNSYELSICCFRRLFKSYSKSKGIFSEYKEAHEALSSPEWCHEF